MQVMNRGVVCDVHMHVCTNINIGIQKYEITSESAFILPLKN